MDNNNQDKKDKNEERHATWLELFYDLIFVVTISQLSHYLFHDVSLSNFFGVLVSLYTSLVVMDRYSILCY